MLLNKNKKDFSTPKPELFLGRLKGEGKFASTPIEREIKKQLDIPRPLEGTMASISKDSKESSITEQVHKQLSKIFLKKERKFASIPVECEIECEMQAKYTAHQLFLKGKNPLSDEGLKSILDRYDIKNPIQPGRPAEDEYTQTVVTTFSNQQFTVSGTKAGIYKRLSNTRSDKPQILYDQLLNQLDQNAEIRHIPAEDSVIHALPLTFQQHIANAIYSIFPNNTNYNGEDGRALKFLKGISKEHIDLRSNCIRVIAEAQQIAQGVVHTIIPQPAFIANLQHLYSFDSLHRKNKKRAVAFEKKCLEFVKRLWQCLDKLNFPGKCFMKTDLKNQSNTFLQELLANAPRLDFFINKPFNLNPDETKQLLITFARLMTEISFLSDIDAYMELFRLSQTSETITFLGLEVSFISVLGAEAFFKHYNLFFKKDILNSLLSIIVMNLNLSQPKPFPIHFGKTILGYHFPGNKFSYTYTLRNLVTLFNFQDPKDQILYNEILRDLETRSKQGSSYLPITLSKRTFCPISWTLSGFNASQIRLQAVRALVNNNYQIFPNN